MALTSTNHNNSSPFGRPKSAFPAHLIAELVARYKAKRAASAAIKELSRHTDAQLADIGLHRSDLAPDPFERAMSERAMALLRAYK